MPNNLEHCQRSLERYGVEGEDIHSWMDEPAKIYGSVHRLLRHELDWIPKQFIDKYGEDLTRNIMLDHVSFDKKSISLRRTPEKGRSYIKLGIETIPDLVEHISFLEKIYVEVEKRIEDLKALTILRRYSQFPAVIIQGHRTTIPKGVRNKMGLRIGDEVDVVIMKAKTFEKEEDADG